MATNIGVGRKGQIRARYQLLNSLTDRYDKYDSDGNYLSSKKSDKPYKSVEIRLPKKPPRG